MRPSPVGFSVQIVAMSPITRHVDDLCLDMNSILHAKSTQNRKYIDISQNYAIKSTQTLLKNMKTPIHALPAPLYRIGAVSKATGIPVSTLRIWETRYGAFSPAKSAGQQRLYQAHDVSKALRLKQLTQAGHAISAMAPLDLDALQRIGHLPHMAPNPSVAADPPISVAVIGLNLANRLASPQLTLSMRPHRIAIDHVCADLDSASQAEWLTPPQALLIQVNALHAEVHTAIAALVQKYPFAQTIVFYNFAPEAVVQAMKFSGLRVRREPFSDSELAELLQSVLCTAPAHAPTLEAKEPVVAERKYTQATLTHVAGLSTSVACECPRHVAELISQLASFEDYSHECLNKTADDAHLHTFLHHLAGQARAMFETALEKIARHEGIDLQDDAQ